VYLEPAVLETLEQAGLGPVQPGLQQPFGDRVAGEVGFHEAHLARGEAQPFQPFSLVSLGGGMVDLELADAGPGVPEGPAVVAGRADDDLAHPRPMAPTTTWSKNLVRPAR
jgi:hypothetical protein